MSTRSVTSWVVAGAAAVVIGTAALALAVLRDPATVASDGAGQPPGTGAAPAPGTSSGSAPASGLASPWMSTAPSRSTSPTPRSTAGPQPVGTGQPATPGSPTLTGRLSMDDGDTTLLGYVASVVVTNPDAVPASGWALTVTLPRSTLSVTDTSGAVASRHGATWEFVPDAATRTVPGRGSVVVRFRVNGLMVDAAPTACSINAHPCEGP